jgi:predicted RNA binding protein YcfA (HicA-like mRNA interferase family)
MSTTRDLEKIVREYRRRGWTVEQTKGQHWRFTPPGGGRFVITSGTPGNVSAINHIKSDLKRCERQAG